MDLSIVIPLYNEEENVEPLYEKLKTALDGAGREYEIIIVDDGSTDGSFDTLKRLHQDDERLKVIRFRRNFGQTAARTIPPIFPCSWRRSRRGTTWSAGGGCTARTPS